MGIAELEMVEIVDLDDDLLLPWFDLYETSFPFSERLLISTQMKILKAKANGEAQHQHLYAALDQNGEFVGLVEYEIVPDVPAAFLWYMAVKPDLRGQGLGTQMYRMLVDRLVPQQVGTLVFEVEIPEHAGSEDSRRLAERRLAFYEKNGARLLEGIHYMQHIGWHYPPTQMHVMVHSRRPVDAHQAYQVAAGVFEDAIRAVGSLTLR